MVGGVSADIVAPVGVTIHTKGGGARFSCSLIKKFQKTCRSATDQTFSAHLLHPS